MEKHLKKRILGALFTVLLLAIVMPIIIDGSQHNRPLNVYIPAQPELGAWKPVANERHVRIDLERLASGDIEREVTMPEIDVVKQDEAPSEGAAPDRAVADRQQLPYAWTLQLGAFKNRKNANALRDQLRSKGYKAYIQEFGKDKLCRVYVGPELQRSKIEAIKTELKTELKQQDIHIKRYRAES